MKNNAIRMEVKYILHSERSDHSSSFITNFASKVVIFLQTAYFSYVKMLQKRQKELTLQQFRRKSDNESTKTCTCYHKEDNNHSTWKN